MSLNVYLKPEVKNASNFNKGSYSDGSPKLSVGGLSLFSDKGRLYAILGQLDSNRSEVSEELEEYVDEYSLYEGIHRFPTRERGRYVHGSA